MSFPSIHHAHCQFQMFALEPGLQDVLLMLLAACTAFPLEISYHADDTVKAQVQYATPESWTEEVDTLIGEIKEGLGSTGKELWDKVRSFIASA